MQKRGWLLLALAALTARLRIFENDDGRFDRSLTDVGGEASKAWDADAIESYTVRHARLTARGFSDEQAEALAERLVRRDLEGDDRRICAECGALDRYGRCRVAAAGRLHGASRQLEPVPTILQRCEGFTIERGMA